MDKWKSAKTMRDTSFLNGVTLLEMCVQCRGANSKVIDLVEESSQNT